MTYAQAAQGRADTIADAQYLNDVTKAQAKCDDLVAVVQAALDRGLADDIVRQHEDAYAQANCDYADGWAAASESYIVGVRDAMDDCCCAAKLDAPIDSDPLWAPVIYNYQLGEITTTQRRADAFTAADLAAQIGGDADDAGYLDAVSTAAATYECALAGADNLLAIASANAFTGEEINQAAADDTQAQSIAAADQLNADTVARLQQLQQDADAESQENYVTAEADAYQDQVDAWDEANPSPADHLDGRRPTTRSKRRSTTRAIS